VLKISPFLVRLTLLLAGALPLPSQAQVESAATPPPPFLLESWSQETALKQRLAVVNADIRSLRAQDNAIASPYPALGVTLAGAGIGVASAVPLVLWAALHPMPHGGEDSAPSRAMLCTFAAGQITGAAMALGGLIALNVRLHQQPNRIRVNGLDDERSDLRRELKRVRKERRYFERLAPDAAVGARGGVVGVRYSFR
jgi:hypothetical protein